MTRTITDPSELDALPVGSVVVEGDHTTPDEGSFLGITTIPGVFHRFPDGWYVVAGYGERAPEEILPATVLHDPSAPTVPVVSDAAVEAGARALRIEEVGDSAPPGFAARQWDIGETPREKPMRLARAALSAALPLLGAAPSATRAEAHADMCDHYATLPKEN